MPPGTVPIGHFLEKTAILRITGEGLPCSENERLFHENSAERRSPEKVLVRLVHLEFEVELFRRKKVGIVKKEMEKRVMQKLKCEGELVFLDLLLKAINSLKGL